MDLKLYDFEKYVPEKLEKVEQKYDDEYINSKYQQGILRIVIEHGSMKLPLLEKIFEGEEYNMNPEYQRRITWSTEKRSKLIESFIINIPIPPVFLYEIDYNKYQLMDGLQRISSIIDFYKDKYKLEKLSEWKELNGKSYSELPSKIREGIDRRQISVITLLKESTGDDLQKEKMKKMVFERLNTGGVTLLPQEVRNALYSGKGNDLCLDLSKNKVFKDLWKIPYSEEEEEEVISETKENKIYKRMGDVELVLRFFAMRNYKNYNSNLSNFLDNYLIKINKESNSNLEILRELFLSTIEKVEKTFGNRGFCLYKDGKWSEPNRTVYDPMMIVLSCSKEKKLSNKEKNIKYLEDIYKDNIDKFEGKYQSKKYIEERIKIFEKLIKQINEEV